MNEPAQKTLRSCLGVVLCTFTAGLLSVLLIDGPETRLAAPAICLQGVIVTSLFCGRLAGLIGSATAGLTFALWLFPPIGSLVISNPADRMVLTLFQLTAVLAALLSPAHSSRFVKANRIPVVIYPPRPSQLRSLERDELQKRAEDRA
jgi:K+-sensing histidine kinase KdpD